MIKRIFLVLFLLFFVSKLSAYEYEIAVCSIFKNCKPYLKEWIEFHRLIGIEHFYLYNNTSTDDPEEVLSPYINQGVVTLIDWPNQKEEEWKGLENQRYGWVFTTQVSAYNHCKQLTLGKVKWLAVIDTDEFIVPMHSETILAYLHEHEQDVCLSIYWQVYGTGGVYDIPIKKLMIELLTLKTFPESDINKTTKVIVKPEYLDYFANSPHWCYLFKPPAYQCPVEEIRINHYIHRTGKFLLEEKWKQKGCMDNVKSSHSDAQALINQWNDVEDRTMERFTAQLKARIGFDE